MKICDNHGYRTRRNAGCSDMGVVASLMPTIQAYVGGACGMEHGNDCRICDADTACVDSVKIQLIVIKLFLENNAEKKKKRQFCHINHTLMNKGLLYQK